MIIPEKMGVALIFIRLGYRAGLILIARRDKTEMVGSEQGFKSHVSLCPHNSVIIKLHYVVLRKSQKKTEQG